MRTLLPRASRRVLLAGAAVIALAAAGIAIADPGAPASTNTLSATFTATALQPQPNHSETCTPTSGDSYTNTDQVFTGTSTGDARLTGAITVHVRSVFDNNTKVGSLKGDIDVATTNPANGHSHAHFEATNVNGTVQGWLDGHLVDGSHFIGSFTAGFSTTGGFNPASIGSSGTLTATAIAWNGHCDMGHPHQNGQQPNGPKHDDHHGPHGDDNNQH
jgi:hypothetical protein